MRRTGRALACALLLAFAGGAAAAEPYKAPRTFHGDPDLQGIWTNASLTVLERPDQFKKLVATEAEAQAYAKASAQLLASIDAPTDPNAGAPEASRDPGGYNAFWLDPGSSLARIDGEYRTSWIVDPPNGKVPYSVGGRLKLFQSFGQFRNMDGPEVRSLAERCIVGFGLTSGPPMLNAIYNNNYQIVQSPGHVAILVEMVHDARIVRLGGTHLPASVRPWMGDTIGRWEGDTLVFETTNLNPGQTFNADIRHRLYMSADAKITERLTRVAEDELLYEFTVDDPKSYSQVWRGEIEMRAAKGPIFEYACHEGNYSLPGILAGARADETAGKGGKKSGGSQ